MKEKGLTLYANGHIMNPANKPTRGEAVTLLRNIQRRKKMAVATATTEVKIKSIGDMIATLPEGEKVAIRNLLKTKQVYVLENGKRIPFDMTKNIGRGCFEIDSDGNTFRDSVKHVESGRKPKRNVEKTEDGRPSKRGSKPKSEAKAEPKKATHRKKLAVVEAIEAATLKNLEGVLDEYAQKLLNASGERLTLAFVSAVHAAEFPEGGKLVIGFLPTNSDQSDIDEYSDEYFANLENPNSEDDEDEDDGLDALDALDDSEDDSEDDSDNAELKTVEEAVEEIENLTDIQKPVTKFVEAFYADTDLFDDYGMQPGDLITTDDAEVYVFIGYSAKADAFAIAREDGDKILQCTKERMAKFEKVSNEAEGDLEDQKDSDFDFDDEL